MFIWGFKHAFYMINIFSDIFIFNALTIKGLSSIKEDIKNKK